MTAPFQTWKVLPHSRLTAVEDNILTVVGEIPMPFGDLPRRMTVVRLADGRLVIFSAIALDEDGMTSLEAYGTPAFLIVPSAIHRLDARIWKDRYLDLKVIAPQGALHKAEEVVVVDATSVDFDDPDVTLTAVPGTQAQEFALQVTSAGGVTLVLNDLVGNIHDERGFAGWLLRLMKFAGDEPHIPRPVKSKLVEDKDALRDQLLRWAELSSLKRILVSHGSPIEDDPAGVLRQLAASLD